MKMFNIKNILIIFLLALTACSAAATDTPALTATSTEPPTAAITLTPPPPTATPIPMALTVNADSFTLEEYNAELTRYKAAMKSTGTTVTDEDAVRAVSDDLISQLLLAQGAVENGFVMDENAFQQRLDALISKLGGADKLAAWQQSHNYSDADFKAALKRAAASAWMRDKIMASVPAAAEQVHVRQLLLYNEDTANNLYEQIKAGTSFDDLAAQVDPVTKGDIGWFPRGYLAEKAVEDAAFSLETGAYSPVVPSEVGFHILKLIERQSDRALSPDALVVLQSRALNDWLAARRQNSSITGTMIPVP
jgi:peptidyl-prolyl cis-trans isomerase C